jgi:hypothetical protein
MEILSEIIEISNQIIDTIDEQGFFNDKETPFVERLPLKKMLQNKMQRKWEEENEMLLTESEFIECVNLVASDSISNTLESLVDKGALNMGIDTDGEIVYSANKDFDLNDL